MYGRHSQGKRRVLQTDSSEKQISSEWSHDYDDHLSYELFSTWNSSINHGRQTFERDPESHRVINLPGLDPSVSLVHYAGHLTVDDASRGNFFYWLFESPNDPLNKPLIIWLNGGPVRCIVLLHLRLFNCTNTFTLRVAHQWMDYSWRLVHFE